jgi:K+-transporting ATPase ATPase A chain
MVRNTRQGWAIFAVMMIVLVGMIAAVYAFEARGVPQEAAAGAQLKTVASGAAAQPGGNMEGKEDRFGIGSSAMFAAITTGTSTGSVNSMHDSYTPLGGMVPLVLMHLGRCLRRRRGASSTGSLSHHRESSYGPMVGEHPEYLGKKIEMYEMKMATLIILIPV